MKMLSRSNVLATSIALIVVSCYADAEADDALLQKHDCLECHEDKGLTFADIGERYRGDSSARDALINVMKNGGKGNWTDVSFSVPMPPYSARLTEAEIERLVDWVLSL